MTPYLFPAWGKNARSSILVPGKEAPRFAYGTPIEEGLELIWRIDAADWNEAMTRYHELQGWEPYQPLSDDS